MAIAYVQSNAANGSGTNLNVAFPGSNTAGNLLICACCADGNTGFNITDSLGNTISAAVNSNRSSTYAWLRYALNCAAGANTVTFTTSSSSIKAVAIAEYSGIATGSALDKTAAGNGYGTAANSGNTADTAQADELLVGAIGAGNPWMSFTAGASYTERQDVAQVKGLQLEDRIVSSTGAYSATATASGSTDWVALIGTFKMAAAGGSIIPSDDRGVLRGMNIGIARGMQRMLR